MRRRQNGSCRWGSEFCIRSPNMRPGAGNGWLWQDGAGAGAGGAGRGDRPGGRRPLRGLFGPLAGFLWADLRFVFHRDWTPTCIVRILLRMSSIWTPQFTSCLSRPISVSTYGGCLRALPELFSYESIYSFCYKAQTCKSLVQSKIWGLQISKQLHRV